MSKQKGQSTRLGQSILILVVGRVYHPEYYDKLSEIFRRYHSKIEKKVKIESEPGSSGCEDAPIISGTDEEQFPPFIPRQLSLFQMLGDLRAPWREYRPLRSSQKCRGIRHHHLAGVDLSHSMSFLLDTGAQLIDIRPEELYEHILKVETSFVEIVTKGLRKLDAIMSTS